MSNVIVVLVLMALSFTVGLLVYRKNGKRIEADALKAKAEAEEAYQEYKAALASLRKS